jgi:transposase
MRGDDVQQETRFSYLSPAARVPQDHPLRPIRNIVNQALEELSGEFQAMSSREGRPSIPPEKLLPALLPQILYTICSACLLMEQLDYNLLFRWFVGLSMDDKVWDHSVFSKNQERFLDSDLAADFRPHPEAGGCRQAAVGRAFHRRRHPDRGLGLSEEFPSQGRPRPPRAAVATRK